MKKIKEKYVDQYERLWEYENELIKVMSETIILLMTEDQELADGRKKIKIFDICLGFLKKGFIKGCRSLLGLDGCHLKGPYDGQLLAVLAFDVNDETNG